MIEIILISIIPAILYLLLIFITTPYTSWKFKKSLWYLLFGTLSLPVILLLLFKLLPWYDSLYEYMPSMLGRYIFLSFIQIALFEETVKYIMFRTYYGISNIRGTNTDIHPLSIMVYSGAIGLGFGLIENISYGVSYGSDVVYWRATSSLLLHMVCGLMMGYWMSLSKYGFKLKTNPTSDVSGTSIFDILMKKRKLRVIFYTTVGIVMASFFHGLYDFNLISTSFDYNDYVYNYELYNIIINIGNVTYTIQLIILAFAMYLVKNMADHLVKLNVKNKII